MLRSLFIVADNRDLPRKQFREHPPEFPTGEADMKSTELVRIAGMFAVMAVLGGGEVATAQTAPAPSSMKTIGTPSAAAKSEVVPSLIVLNSRGATLQG